jgi:hypothetical protein
MGALLYGSCCCSTQLLFLLLQLVLVIATSLSKAKPGLVSQLWVQVSDRCRFRIPNSTLTDLHPRVLAAVGTTGELEWP